MLIFICFTLRIFFAVRNRFDNISMYDPDKKALEPMERARKTTEAHIRKPRDKIFLRFSVNIYSLELWQAYSIIWVCKTVSFAIQNLPENIFRCWAYENYSDFDHLFQKVCDDIDPPLVRIPILICFVLFIIFGARRRFDKLPIGRVEKKSPEPMERA